MTRDNEVWKPVPDCNYEASSLGRVRRYLRRGQQRIGTGRILKSMKWPNHGGKLREFVSICDGSGGVKTKYVHALVASAFFGPRPNGYHVNHIDGDTENNHVGNLEYVTPAENERHAVKNGLKATGERHGSRTAPFKFSRLWYIYATHSNGVKRILAREETLQ